MEHIELPRRADFSERGLAFALDYALFAGSWALTLKAAAPHDPIAFNPLSSLATVLWTGVFVAYQAYFSAAGRATLGKRLLGLRVVGVDGEPLDLFHAGLRSVGYLASQFFAAGFLWSLMDPLGRAWHDLPVRSLVVADASLPSGRRALLRLSTGFLMIGFAAVWGWQNIWGPRYDRLLTVAHAKNGLNEIAQLQESYKLRHGRYADSLFALASVSVDPQGLVRDAYALYDDGRVGFQIRPDHYIIVARANDVDKTLVAVSGP